jgi:hypothetical protein
MSSQSETGLIHYDAWMKELVLAHRIDEVTQIQAQARAFEVYAKQAKNLEGERLATEIRIRAERRAGDMLREMGENGQRKGKGQPPKETGHDGPLIPSLKNLGVSPKQSKTWQALSKVPEEQFEAAINDPVVKPTTAGIISRTEKKNIPPADPQALWVWGRLKDFEREVLDVYPKAVALKIDSTLVDDVMRLGPLVSGWISKLVEELQ